MTADSGAGAAPAQGPERTGRPARSLQRMFAAVVLVGELFVIGFAILAARVSAGVPTSQVLTAGAALALLALVAAATLRSPVGYALGWLVQVLLLVSAIWVPMMVVVGLVFAGLWTMAVVKGGQADRLTAHRETVARDGVEADGRGEPA